MLKWFVPIDVPIDSFHYQYHATTYPNSRYDHGIAGDDGRCVPYTLANSPGHS